MKRLLNLFSFFIVYGRIFPAICVNTLTALASPPAEKYFQQEVNYKIQVTLNDKLHVLNAFETIEYINKSPDTLSVLYFHLWANAYSGNNTALAGQILKTLGRERLFEDPELRGYVDSLDFKINGEKTPFHFLKDIPDVCKIYPDESVFPGDTIIITTPFRVKIPLGKTSRLGYIGESYQISQWYPKPAVYDMTGWHPMEYLDQGEFYSDFGNFDVTITLPSAYIAGATGKMINETKNEWLTMLSSDTSMHDLSNQMKTLNFVQDNAHDFAWFADKRFFVKKGRIILPSSGKVIETAVMYTGSEEELWKDALEYVNDAISYFSGVIGDYPYDTFTAVQAALTSGSGMEYPGITVIDHSDNAYSLDQVIAHEICHSWFYGAVGNNERQYPFLDEGVTSAYEQRYMQDKYPEKKAWEIYMRNKKVAKFFNIDEIPAYGIDELEWLIQARRNLERPLDLPATEYTPEQYSNMIYYKAGVAFNYLRAYLGDSVFDTIMHDYYNKWKFRHPGPDDLRRSFESATVKNLDWFFTDLIGTTKFVDYKIIRMRNERLLIKNNGDLASPLVIANFDGDKPVFEKWSDGFTGKKWIDVPNKGNFKIDPFHQTPELYRLNNNFRTSALLPRADPVETQFYFTIEDPEKLSLMYIPLPNWTREDGFMAGIAFHNGFILPERIEYFILPFYSFGSKTLDGHGRLVFNIIPRNSFIRLIKLNLDGSRFGIPGSRQYNRIRIGPEFSLGYDRSLRSTDHSIYGYLNRVTDLYPALLNEPAKMRSFLQVGYILDKRSSIDPFNIHLAFETDKTFAKASGEFNYRFSYYGRNNGLDVRIFSGLMLRSNPARPFYSFSSAGRSGREQYLFQGIYPDRFAEPVSNFWSRQMSVSEGSLISPVNDSLGYSPWLVSLSLMSSLPHPIESFPVRPFLNFVFSEPANSGSNPVLLYEAGLKTGIRNVFEIYVPVFVSQALRAVNGSFRERIRFTLNLDLQSISLF